jgi:hypothetical protein
MNGRNGKQCRERWINHLKPDISKEPWSKEEDDVLIRAYTEIGTKWSEMEKLLKGRTENAIKNHWHSTLRKRKDVVSFLGSATGNAVGGGDGTEGTATKSWKRRRTTDDEGNRENVSPGGVSGSMPEAPAAAPAAPIMPPKIAPPAVAPAARIMSPKIAPPAAVPAAPIMLTKVCSAANATGQSAGTTSLLGASISREGA